MKPCVKKDRDRGIGKNVRISVRSSRVSGQGGKGKGEGPDGSLDPGVSFPVECFNNSRSSSEGRRVYAHPRPNVERPSPQTQSPTTTHNHDEWRMANGEWRERDVPRSRDLFVVHKRPVGRIEVYHERSFGWVRGWAGGRPVWVEVSGD